MVACGVGRRAAQTQLNFWLALKRWRASLRFSQPCDACQLPFHPASRTLNHAAQHQPMHLPYTVHIQRASVEGLGEGEGRLPYVLWSSCMPSEPSEPCRWLTHSGSILVDPSPDWLRLPQHLTQVSRDKMPTERVWIWTSSAHHSSPPEAQTWFALRLKDLKPASQPKAWSFPCG